MNRAIEAEAKTGAGRRRIRAIPAALLALALSTGLFGCDTDGKCSACETDEECDSGMTCETFEDGYGRCAVDADTKCQSY